MAPGWRAAADRGGDARNAAAVWLHRAAAARSRACDPALSPDGTSRGARPGSGRGRARRLSAVAHAAGGRDAGQARLLGSTRRGAAGGTAAELAERARLVDPVAAGFGVLVGGVRAPIPPALARAARARRTGAPRAARDSAVAGWPQRRRRGQRGTGPGAACG